MFGFVRGAIFYVVLAISVIVLGVAMLACAPFLSVKGRYERLCRPWARFVLAALRAICGVTYRTVGAQNFPSVDTPCVVLAKHQSAWDPFWLGAELPGGACFLYKRSLHWIPVIGWLLKWMHMVPIDRAKGRSAFQSFMTIGKARLTEGWWICLFPEGTRVAPGATVPLKTGGARFACAQGVPVLPIMHNAGHCWPKNSIAKHPGTITVVVGEPIDTTGLEPHEVTQRVQDWYVAVEKEIDAGR